MLLQNVNLLPPLVLVELNCNKIKSSISPVNCEISYTVNSAITLARKSCYENSHLFQCLVFIWKQCEHNVSLWEILHAGGKLHPADPSLVRIHKICTHRTHTSNVCQLSWSASCNEPQPLTWCYNFPSNFSNLPAIISQ